jgi:fructokinase
MSTPLWGFDLGGTKIEGAILESRDNPRPIARLRIPTEAHLGYRHIIGQVEKLTAMLSAETSLRPDSIGLAHPGALDPITGTMKNANTVCLIGQPFDRDLSACLGGIPVRLANDANCFAVAETLMGAVPDVLPTAEVVFGIIIGTGVGGGVVVRGKVINGRQGIGGEWGHNPLDPTVGTCYCGREGCVEMVFSGPALQRYYTQLSGHTKHLPDIVALAEQGDAHAEATLQRLFSQFGRAVASVINILDPDVIVIGGGVGNIDRLYTEGVDAARPHVFNPRLDTIFTRPKLGDSAGVFGAALL